MCWLSCRLRSAQMLHVLVVLQVTWRSDATCVGCVAGYVALRCYMCWLCCRLRSVQMIHVLVVLQVT